MNRKIFIKTALFLVFIGGFFINPIIAQSDIYKIELEERYPMAKNVKWEMDDGYITAEFIDEFGQEVEVWYNSDANWVRTKTDMFFRNLPERIKKAYQDSQYAKWKVDDIDFVQTPDEDGLYILEVEKGEQEYKLYISEKGIIHRR